ncbi:MAG: DUF58 domain-containing protein [Solirubrobacterales bacterium]
MAGARTAAVLGATLVLAGAGFGTPSLYVAGIGLVALVAVAAVWVELARPSRLDRAPGPARIVEGDPYPIELTAVGARIPPPAGEIVDPVLGEPIEVGPRWRGRLSAGPTLWGRGIRRLGPARIEVRDPFGIWSRSVSSAPAGQLLVLPRIEPVVASGGGSGGASRGSAASVDDAVRASRSDLRAIELEVDGLRPYREGTTASRIHWPAVARSGELIERRLIAGADSSPLVVCDSARPDSEEALDAAVRAAASLCVHLAGLGGCSLLMCGDRRPREIGGDLRGWPEAHARLALVEPATSPPTVTGLRTGTVFWVAGRAGAQLPEGLRSTPAPRWVVVPGEFADATFTVAGCSGRPARRAARKARRRAAA